jgi:tetratricopeptide (TPR) repeat protein
MRNIIVIYLTLFLITPSVFAEKIILKNGKSVEGKIIEKTSSYIKIDFEGVTLTYFNDEISSIEGEVKDTSASVFPKGISVFYKNGLKYAMENKYKEASEAFRKSLEKDKFNYPSADALQIIDDVDKGIISKETAQNLFNAAHSFYYGQQYGKAESYIRKAINANPSYAYSYDMYGTVIFTGSGIAEPAVPYIKKAIELDSGNPFFYEHLGILYFFSMEYDKAKINLLHAKEAFELNGNNQELKIISNFLKQVEEKNNLQANPTAAPGDSLGKASGSKNTDAASAKKYYEQGIDNGKKGKLNEALSNFNRAIELNPNYAEAYERRGLTQQLKGWFEDALSDYNKAIEINPKFAEAYNNKGVTYAALRRNEQALSSYNKALELKPNYTDAYNNIGALYFGLGQFQEAIANYKKVLEADPKHTLANYNLGNTYSFMKEYKKAIACYARVIELDPTNVMGYANIGIMYYYSGNMGQAKNNLQKAKDLFLKNNNVQGAKKVDYYLKAIK